ncbi:hypothetical protein ACROYT_G024478 [Oculina patagonica]
MLSAKIAILVVLVALIVFVDHSEAWRRRRRRRCSPRNCQVSSWSSWSSCSASQCGQYGSQSRSRTVTTTSACGGAACPNLKETRYCYGTAPQDCQVRSWSYWSSCSTSQCGQQGSQSRSRTVRTSSGCGGAPCPDLRETRQCYGTRSVNCQLSSWSKWSACTTPCGISGTQSSSRHRITTEQCGGTCTSTFHKTRRCPYLSCLNGGSLRRSICFCKEGFSGECCEIGGGREDKINCQLSPWSEWSACSTPCGVLGTQSSSRDREVLEEYGGTCTSTFQKTRACLQLSCMNGGSLLKDGRCSCLEGYSGVCCDREKMNCQLSIWSEWGPCSTPCGVSGTQSSSRHRIIMEQYGGTCTSNFRRTRACPELTSCLNGGTLQHETCSCAEDYSGSCCQIAAQKQKSINFLEGVFIALGVIAVVGAVVLYHKCRRWLQ